MPAQTKTAKSNASIAVMGIDIGKNVFHLIGLDQRGAIVFKSRHLLPFAESIASCRLSFALSR